MFDQMQDLLQWRADLLMAGRYEDLSREYLFPYVIYKDGTPMVIMGSDVHVSAVAHLHISLRQRQVHRCIASVTAVELPRNGRLRVWAQWLEVSCDPDQNRQAELIHYFRETPHGYRSEMLEFVPQRVVGQRSRLSVQRLRA